MYEIKVYSIQRNFILSIQLLFLGMWSSSYFCGAFVGPTLGGLLVQNFGFPATTVIFASVLCLVTLLDTVELAISKYSLNYKPLK